MENKEEEKDTSNSEISITRRSVLGAGAVIAGAGVLGSKLIDPIAAEILAKIVIFGLSFLK